MLNLSLKRTIFVRLFVMAFLVLFVFSHHKDAILLLAASPTVTTSAASSVAKTTATLNGSISDNGGENVTEVGFEYGLSASYGSSTTTTSSYTYNSHFGSSGSGDGQFSSPNDIEIDSFGNIFVVDNVNNRIQKFNSSGVYVSQFGSSGSGDGQFNLIGGLVIDSSDNVYVTDFNNHRVQKFNSSGVYVSQFGSSGSGNGQFNQPFGIEIDSLGDIYVADFNNDRIQKFNSSGVYVSQFGSSGSGDGQFNSPTDLVFDSSGNIYVTDTGNNRVQKFNSSGVYVSQFGSSGSGDGQFNSPTDLVFDSSGNIYVTDTGNNRVQKFNSSGVYVSQFGSSGLGNGQFSQPTGIKLDSSGNIYVSELTGGKRVQKFNLRIDPTQITGLTCGTTYHFRAYAENADGTSYGDDTTFTTLTCEPPEVDTVSATSVSQTTATLNGLYVDMPVVPGLTRGFQYGPTTSYGQSVSENGNEYVSQFGSSGSGNGQFNAPQSLVIGSSGAIYVADTGNNRVQKFDSSGNWILNITGNSGAFSSPSSVYVDASENVYVSDTGNNRVQKFDSSGNFLLEIGTGLFGATFTVAVDASGNIYVADVDANRIAKFDSSGNYPSDFASGEVSVPYSIDFDSSGNVYVADAGFTSIRVFNSAGTLMTDLATGQFGSIFYADVDSHDHLYVVDQDNVRILKYNTSGTLLYELGGVSGTGNGELSLPYGVTADSSDNIYVADSGNHRIQKFSLDFSLPISSLGCSDTYHYRAFATNADGTGYGEDMIFTAGNCPPTGGGGDNDGCTDPTADNYDPDAENDDGSCEFWGCMDRDATNFDPTANVPVNDYCIYTPGAFPGCTDILATNHDPNATVDDGSCLYGVFGCMDTTATNYNSSAVYSDGSCEYDGGPITTLGCMDSGALNFNPSANVDDGSCDFPDPLVYGCTDVSASNFNPSANEDNGSCSYINPDNPGIGQTISHISQFIGNLPEVVTIPIVAVGVVAPSLLLNFLQPGLIAGALIRLWNLIPILMGYRRKKRPWGTVYDSVTKQPLDPVYVKLLDQNGQERGTSITDLDGRYGFLAEAGTYTLSANKDNYIFPSTKLSGKSEDELYHNLYFGGPVELAEKEGVIYKNIPMDAINFNWNEFAKAENKKLMKFYSKRDLFFARIANTLFIAGFVSSVILFLTNMSTLNSIILGLYVLILVLRFFGIKPKQSGYAFDVDGTPLSFGILRLFSVELGREVAHTVVGKTGRYYMLTPNGEYYLKVSKKTGEDSYEEVLTTGAFRVKGGYVNEKISL